MRVSCREGYVSASAHGFRTLCDGSDSDLPPEHRRLNERRARITHQPPEENNAAFIYTLPAGGGSPERVTAKGPSYLHGWSPDARRSGHDQRAVVVAGRETAGVRQQHALLMAEDR
jgi:hypothetical protein